MAAAGATLAETPRDITPHAGTPPEHSEHRQVVSKLERLGKLGQEDKELPAVNAEPSEYYGGHQVWSRARTFSDVGDAVSDSGAWCANYHRLEWRAPASDDPCRWRARPSRGTGGSRMVSAPM